MSSNPTEDAFRALEAAAADSQFERTLVALLRTFDKRLESLEQWARATSDREQMLRRSGPFEHGQ